MAHLEQQVQVEQQPGHADGQADHDGQRPQPAERTAGRDRDDRPQSRVEPRRADEQRIEPDGGQRARERDRERHPAVRVHHGSPPKPPTGIGRSAGRCNCCQAAASGVLAVTTATCHPAAARISAVRAVSSGTTSDTHDHAATIRAIAGAFPRLLAASILASSGDSRPSTAISWPPVWVSAVAPDARLTSRDGLMTASMSSSVSWNVPRGAISPASVISRARKPSPVRCAPIEAAALTANSNVAEDPVPTCARRRVSRNTDALLRHWCSSRRTISSPYLAVDFQCTRCRLSPSWYTRGAASSSPIAEIVRIPPSPSPSQLLCAAARGSGKILGVTTSVLVVLNDRLISTSPNASATRTRSGPMVNLPRVSEWIW